MNKTLSLVLIAGIFSSVVTHTANADQPQKGKDGMYWQYLASDGDRLFYQVDTISQLCFAWLTNGLTNIPCSALARRPEWKPIIDWVDTKK